MKKSIFAVLVIAAITVGCDQAEDVSSVNEEVAVPVEVVEVEGTQGVSMITPADMSDQAQTDMFTAIGDYNKCMMQNRLEYHQQGINIPEIADKTLTACEPQLDKLDGVLVENNVNKGLRINLINTMRSRAARKLMSAMMQSMAGQAAAEANAERAVQEEAAAQQ